MKKLHSVITVGCLVGSLLLSSANYTFGAEEVKEEVMDTTETEISVNETETRVDRSEAAPEETVVAQTAETLDGAQPEQVMCFSDGETTQDPQGLAAYLSEDPAMPQEAITLTSEKGAVIDGYQLNHDKVKVLNINTGNVTIHADTYTQENGETDAPWDAKTDAYVIRGKGNNTNNITIASPQTKVTIYLMDLEWNGTINYTQATDVEFVICGSVVNNNYFLTSANDNALTIRGISEEGNSISIKYSLFNSCTLKTVLMENVKITANNCGYGGTTTSLQIVNSELDFTTIESGSNYQNLVVDHSKVRNIRLYRNAKADGAGVIIRNNSEAENLQFFESTDTYETVIEISDSIATKIENYYYIYNDSRIKNIYKMIASNSILNISTSPITTLEADKCTIEVQNNLAFKNFIANSCSIKGAFVGTAVDFDEHDLFLKTVRLREHPDEYVYVSVDGGEKVKFLADLNGCVYPYIRAGSTSLTVTTEDGTKYSAKFDPITESDKEVTILTPGENGGDSGEGGDTEKAEKPEINDTLLVDQYKNLKDSFSLSITAKSKTSPANLSYQWYKDGQPIDTAKGKKRTYSITSTKAEHAGVYCCYVTDNNNGEVSVSKEVYVTVNVPADPDAPKILNQSASMDLVKGSSVTLSVNAIPANIKSEISFQWYKGTEALEGKTSRNLVLANVKASDAGNYHCVITDTIAKKTTDSSVTVITVK